MQDLQTAVAELLQHVRQGPLKKLKVEIKPELQQTSIFDAVPADLKSRVLQLAEDSAQTQRAIGSMVGMAVADSLGHNFEFLPVADTFEKDDPHIQWPSPDASKPGGVLVKPYNKFNLKSGQWTDDCSMGLCVADSLLMCDGYDGSFLRILFFHWWYNGLNNAFRLDKERQKALLGLGPGFSLSVGLGGNIAQSLRSLKAEHMGSSSPPSRFESPGEDAGNGSLMRLAPIPIFFSDRPTEAAQLAAESSLTTHPGQLAAEACRFMSRLIACAIRRPEDDTTTAAAFLDQQISEYLRELDTRGITDDARTTFRRLLQGEEDDSSTERCWSWRNKNLGLVRTVINRGQTYNGYPVSAEYFGSFSIDGTPQLAQLLILKALSLHLMHVPLSIQSRIGSSYETRQTPIPVVIQQVLPSLCTACTTRTASTRQVSATSVPTATPHTYMCFSQSWALWLSWKHRDCEIYTLNPTPVVKCINFRGDADTTASICAQIAGAFYGIGAIEPAWIESCRQWDEREIELRAICLHVRGEEIPPLIPPPLDPTLEIPAPPRAAAKTSWFTWLGCVQS